MKIDTMKALDHRVGLVICVVLDAFHRFARLFRGRPKDVGPVEQILVTKYFGMGSILLATPMMQALRKQFPAAKITLLTFECNREFGELLTCVDEVLALRTRGFGGFISGVIAALWRLRAKRLDVAVDLEFFSKFSTIVTYLSGARIRVGFQLRSLWRGDLLTHPVYMNQHRHITRAYFAMAEAVGCELDDDRATDLWPSRAALRISEEARSRVAKLAERLPGSRLIAMNPNASELSFERRWPADRFVELAKRLREAEPGAGFCFIGGQEERPYVETIVEQCGEWASNLAGQLSVEELLPFFERCDLFITNDSGPLHMACLVGTRTVSFFGPETPAFYGPLGDRAVVFYKHFYCSPCLSAYNVKTTECRGDNRCMQAIEVDEVARAALGLLAERAATDHAAGE